MRPRLLRCSGSRRYFEAELECLFACISKSVGRVKLHQGARSACSSLVPGMGPWSCRGYAPGISSGDGAHDDDSASPPGE